MPCQELSWPAPQCGFQGTCVENLVNETSICKCDNGWSQLPELVYFNDDVPLSSFPCGHNTTFLNVLYSVCLFLSAVVVILQISIIKSTKQLKKAAIPILVHMLLITACVLRLSNPSESLLGISVAFSFFIGMLFLIFNSFSLFFFYFLLLCHLLLCFSVFFLVYLVVPGFRCYGSLSALIERFNSLPYTVLK